MNHPETEGSLPPRVKAQTFHTMDMLRGIAAVTVVVYHSDDAWFGNPLPNGYLAVDLFFMLSGFVISHAYSRKLGKTLTAAGFMKVRLTRLWPMYILGSLLAFPIFLATHHEAARQNILLVSLFSLFFLPTPPPWSFSVGHLYILNPPGWSLFWELVINAAYAFTIKWLKTGLLVFLVSIGALLLAHAAWSHDSLNGGFSFHTFPVGLERVLYSFFMGVIVFRLWQRGWTSNKVPAWLLGLALVGIFLMRAPNHRPLFDFLVVVLVFPLIVFFSTNEPGKRLLPISRLLGLLSYPIYALQFASLSPMTVGIKHFHLRGTVGGFVWWFVWFAGFVAFALVCERWIDRPARRWLTERFAKKPALGLDSAPSSQGSPGLMG